MARGTKTDELGDFFLGRLRRFVELDGWFDERDSTGRGRLVRSAVLSTYRDCCALGLADEATRILTRPRSEVADGGEG